MTASPVIQQYAESTAPKISDHSIADRATQNDIGTGLRNSLYIYKRPPKKDNDYAVNKLLSLFLALTD
jgi:hypothetical protein